MKTFEFISKMTIKAETREEAESKFADESTDFAANAEVKELSKTRIIKTKREADNFISKYEKQVVGLKNYGNYDNGFNGCLSALRDFSENNNIEINDSVEDYIIDNIWWS